MHIVITGPSGSGKSSIISYITKYLNIPLSVSYTTRKIRPNEIDGKDYHFITTDKFIRMIENNELIEYTLYNNNYYGTGNINKERLIFDLEYEGVLYLKKTRKNILYIYIDVDKITLEDRLVKRGTEKKDLENRMKNFDRFEELKNKVIFDLYVDNNGNIEESIEKIIKFIERY